MNILLVPAGTIDLDGASGSTLAWANADIVISQDGRVLKDRNSDTWVKVLSASNPEPQATPPPLARRVAVSLSGIKALLEEAIQKDATVEIDYEDAEGNSTTRLILPKSISEPRGFGRYQYVSTFDLDKNEPRSFRLDRIEQVEL